VRGIGDQRQRSGQHAADPLDGDEQRIERNTDGKGPPRSGTRHLMMMMVLVPVMMVVRMVVCMTMRVIVLMIV
jgi:hypothetical protein